MNRMGTSQTVTGLEKVMVVKPGRVLVGRLRRDGQVDGRTGLRLSEYHTGLLGRIGRRELLRRMAHEGYQVELRGH